MATQDVRTPPARIFVKWAANLRTPMVQTEKFAILDGAYGCYELVTDGTAQQAQRIAELEAENARLRANSFVAAVEAIEKLCLDGPAWADLGFKRVANWLSRQAPQGKKGRRDE